MSAKIQLLLLLSLILNSGLSAQELEYEFQSDNCNCSISFPNNPDQSDNEGDFGWASQLISSDGKNNYSFFYVIPPYYINVLEKKELLAQIPGLLSEDRKIIRESVFKIKKVKYYKIEGVNNNSYFCHIYFIRKSIIYMISMHNKEHLPDIRAFFDSFTFIGEQ